MIGGMVLYIACTNSGCARYTSLGCTDNTLPNPFLKDPRQPFGYKPAHMLQDHDGQEERAGRQ